MSRGRPASLETLVVALRFFVLLARSGKVGELCFPMPSTFRGRNEPMGMTEPLNCKKIVPPADCVLPLGSGCRNGNCSADQGMHWSYKEKFVKHARRYNVCLSLHRICMSLHADDLLPSGSHLGTQRARDRSLKPPEVSHQESPKTLRGKCLKDIARRTRISTRSRVRRAR